MFKKIKNFITRLIRFISKDIWHVDHDDVSRFRGRAYNMIKAFILAVRNIKGAQINTRAAALTYNTLLSIVPLLAVLFAIAGGFGFQNLIKTELFTYFAGQEAALTKAMTLIDSSIEYAKGGGVFLGVGLVILFYTVINLLSKIEESFNTIWQIKTGRSLFRKFTDYLALIIIAPIFLIVNAGFSLLLSTTAEHQYIIGLVITPFVKMIPFLITILLFTFLYIYIPNTKVKFKSALFAGIFAGVAFQGFQLLYISGQIWITKYNAIYGSFAALPLLLLWLQLTWFICLFGVELAFAHQNVRKYDFEQETTRISRRYRDFIILLITNLIIKRFEKGDKPYTADEISENYKIPTKLTTDVLYQLVELGILVETPIDDSKIVPAYVPAMDIQKITVAYLFEKVDREGSEDFKIDITAEYEEEWQEILEIRRMIDQKEKDVLIKDL